MKGGGNLADACRKKFVDGTGYFTNMKDDRHYEAILEKLQKIPDNDFLILKLGSNDLADTTNGSADPGGAGRCGSGCKLFIELRQINEEYKEATYARKTSAVAEEGRALKAHLKLLGPALASIENDHNRIHVVAISPMPEYGGFSYPFIYTEVNEYNDNLYSRLHSPDKNRSYLTRFFPISAYDNLSSNHGKILHHLIHRSGPLFLFNALGSLCIPSVKYIIDMRGSGKITYYGGAVDNHVSAECEIGIPIYPNPAEKCQIKQGGFRRKNRTRRRRIRVSTVL